MKKKLVSILLAGMLLVSIIPGASAGVETCGGLYGVRVYQDSNLTGPSWLVCSNTVGVIQDSDLSNNTTNLSFGANWNDRITSLRAYNATSSSKRFRLYPDKDYKDNAVNLERFVTISGNAVVNNLRDYWPNYFDDGFNDVVSSFKTLPN